jgi:hypothetical protein
VWRRALVAYLAWLLANAVAGAVVAIASQPLRQGSGFGFFVLNGVVAGVAFGVAQWLAVRPFLPKLRLWAPATAVYSPVSWVFGYVFALLTLGYGGWLGAGVSALGQWLLLARSTGREGVSFLWVPASLIGGAIFYFCYLVGTVELLFAASIAYALVTGLVVALLVVVTDRSIGAGKSGDAKVRR